MVDGFRKHDLKVPPPEDEKSVQTLASDSTYDAFGNRVGAECPNRHPDGPDALAGRNSVEGAANSLSLSWIRQLAGHPS
jgi:hypothetical protein